MRMGGFRPKTTNEYETLALALAIFISRPPEWNGDVEHGLVGDAPRPEHWLLRDCGSRGIAAAVLLRDCR